MKLLPKIIYPAVVIALAGCATTSVAKTPATATPATSSSAPATPAAATTPAAGSLTGGIGTSYTVTTTNNGDQPVKYIVKLTHFHQHAAPDNSFDAAPAGSHLVGAEFLIVGLQGHESDDANSDVSTQGSNQETYQPSFSGLAAGTNFNSGQFSVSAGQSEIGWVAFQVPDSVHVASVQWDGSGGFGSNPPATWTVKR